MKGSFRCILVKTYIMSKTLLQVVTVTTTNVMLMIYYLDVKWSKSWHNYCNALLHIFSVGWEWITHYLANGPLKQLSIIHYLQGTPFFNGKLILHDPPGMGNGTRGVVRPFTPGNVLAASSNNTGFLMTSPTPKLGAIPKKMPSPAAQVRLMASICYFSVTNKTMWVYSDFLGYRSFGQSKVRGRWNHGRGRR